MSGRKSSSEKSSPSGQPNDSHVQSSGVNRQYNEQTSQAAVSPGSFRDFYEANWLPMVRLAVLLTGDSTHAEDATQDAFLAVHKKWRLFGPDDSPRGYLRAAVVNQCRMVTRKRITFWRKAPIFAGRDPSQAPLDLVGPHYDMWKAVSALPQRMREVVVLRYYEDCDIRTVAEVLNITEGTVKSTTAKALTKLSTVLDPKD